MVRVGLQLPEGAELRLQVHDSMVLTVPEESEATVVELIIRELAVPIVIYGEELVIPVEVKRSKKSWGEMEEGGVFNQIEGG